MRLENLLKHLSTICKRGTMQIVFRHRSQHGAVNPVADWLPVGIRRDRDLGDADDVSTPRHHVARAHRTVHEAADNHAARLEKQLDVGRDPR